MIKAIFFDFDGTVVDGLPALIKCLNKLAKKYGYGKVTRADLQERSMQRAVKEVFGLSFYQYLGFAKRFKVLLDQEVKNAKLIRGMKKIIKELSRSYSIGLVAMVSKENARHAIDYDRIEGVKFVYHDCPATNKHKIIRYLLRKYKLARSEVIYVGDKIGDIQACKKAGIKMIAVSWGYNSKNILKKEKPDYLIDHPKELLEILK